LATTAAPTTTSSPTTLVEAPAPTERPTTTTTATTVAVAPDGAPVSLVPEVVNRFPHDDTAFTQGLERRGALLIEGLGEYGASSRRLVDPATGRVTAEAPLPPQVFGNGVTVVGDRLIQLTWQSGTAFVASADTLEELDRFDYEGEGWGLCALPDRLAMSDGSSRLTFRDRETFAETGQITVTLDGRPLERLNELECVDGSVWANVWLTTSIVQIDPTTGIVTAVVDAASLVPTDQPLAPDDVLNGIAHNAEAGTFFVTGKRWNVLYEVRFVPAG
jgi:glutaminyl-peptide cyclotransferase